MDIVTDSVNRLEETLQHSGCEETGVSLDVDPDAKTCQYERGACMLASFGGRTAEFVTEEPIRAMTKISFMFGTPLETPNVRSAACAIVNVVTAFFCLNRVLRACPTGSHAACLQELARELEGHRVFCVGDMPALEKALGSAITVNFDDADTLIINNEGIIDPKAGDLVVRAGEKKRVVFLGPSTAGVCRLQQREHWCPYGK
ncbi:MAG: hypothetical protein LUQ31_05805 [Methanoregula sp.]|nr:hypothetical protein [Methanoregula sp.]